MGKATWQQKLVGAANALITPRILQTYDRRIAYYDPTVNPCSSEYNQHVVYVFWHEYISVVLPTWGHTAATILCSKHRDGEWINQIGKAMGLHVVRGSSSRGGSSAIRQLKKNSKFSSLVITPDGPRGPRREMAIGPIYMASMLRMPIVPVAVGIDDAYRLKTWDQFAIPKPLTRIRLIAGPKIEIPRKADRDVLESSRLGVQRLLNRLCDEADQWATSGQVMQNEQPLVRNRLPRKLFLPAQPKRVQHTVLKAA